MSSVSETNLSILEEHIEEVIFLWAQWSRAKQSLSVTLHEVRALEERIEAHAMALHAYRREAAAFLSARLTSEDPNEVRSAAWLLLRQKEPGIGECLVRLLHASTDLAVRAGLVEALALAGDPATVATVLKFKAGSDQQDLQLHQLYLSSLRASGELSPVRLEKFLRDSEPTVRVQAWRNARLLVAPPPPEQTLAGALDDHAAVRELAMETSAWAGQTWLLDHCRRAAAKPSLTHAAELRLLAVLALEHDAALMLSLAGKSELGVLRFQLLGSYAKAGGVACLIEGMAQPDSAMAAAAGEAFTRITGLGLRMVGRVTIPPPEGSIPDAFDEQFLEEVELPDANEAAEYWKTNEARYVPGLRYSQGLPVPDGPPFAGSLNLVSIREACLRAAFNRKPGPKAVEFERYPILF